MKSLSEVVRRETRMVSVSFLGSSRSVEMGSRLIHQMSPRRMVGAFLKEGKVFGILRQLEPHGVPDQRRERGVGLAGPLLQSLVKLGRKMDGGACRAGHHRTGVDRGWFMMAVTAGMISSSQVASLSNEPSPWQVFQPQATPSLNLGMGCSPTKPSG